MKTARKIKYDIELSKESKNKIDEIISNEFTKYLGKHPELVPTQECLDFAHIKAKEQLAGAIRLLSGDSIWGFNSGSFNVTLYIDSIPTNESNLLKRIRSRKTPSIYSQKGRWHFVNSRTERKEFDCMLASEFESKVLEQIYAEASTAAFYAICSMLS